MSHKRVDPFKIALYIRVSTEEQAENPEGSIKNQEDRLRQAIDYKNRHGNFGEIQGVYVDAGISAKNMRRPQLQELLRAVQSREVDLIMVTEISRLSRNTRDFIDMWDMMRAHKCMFTSLREDFDTTNAAGEMVLFQLMNLAQFERKQTSERVEANLAARSSRGLYNGGVVPVGLRTIPERPGYLEICPESSGIIQMAFAAFLREGSLARAALWLNDHGYALRKQNEGGGRFKRVGHFTIDNLQTILRNKAYVGIKAYSHRGEHREVKAVWPALIDSTTFARAGKMLDQNYRKYKPENSSKLPYILTGVVFCEKCKSSMVGKSATGNGGKVGYYEHGWATKRDSTLSKKIFKCDPHRVPSKKMEPLVWEKVLQFISDPRMVRLVLQKVREQHASNPHRQELERVKAKMSGVKSQIEALSERLAELPKAISAAPIYRQLEKLQGVLSDHEKFLVDLKSSGISNMARVMDFEAFEDFATHHRSLVFNQLTDSQKKQLVKKFVSRVDVGAESVKIRFIVDKYHYAKERTLQVPLERHSRSGELEMKNLISVGSNTLTIGGPTRIRYEHQLSN